MKLTDIEPYNASGDPIKHVYLEFVGENDENVSGKSNKFWEGAIFERDQGYVLVRRWGKYGKKGQVKEQFFYGRYEAKQELRKLKHKKRDKGYTKEVDLITRLGLLVEDDD